MRARKRAREPEERAAPGEDPSAGWTPIHWDGSQASNGTPGDVEPFGAPANAATAPQQIMDADRPAWGPPPAEAAFDGRPSTWRALADPAATAPQPLERSAGASARPSDVVAPAASAPPLTGAPAALPTIAASTATDLVAAVEALVLRLRDLSTREKAIGRRGDLRALGVAAYQRAQLLKLELTLSGALPASTPSAAPVRPNAAAHSSGPPAARPPGTTPPPPPAPKPSWRARRRARRAERDTTERVRAAEAGPEPTSPPDSDAASAPPPVADPPAPPAKLSWRARRRARRAELRAGAAMPA